MHVCRNNKLLTFCSLQIFEKALDEPKYSSVYAKLCHQLCEDAPNFEPKDSTIPVSAFQFHWLQASRLIMPPHREIGGILFYRCLSVCLLKT